MESTSGPTRIATVTEPLIDFFNIFSKHLSISLNGIIMDFCGFGFCLKKEGFVFDFI